MTSRRTPAPAAQGRLLHRTPASDRLVPPAARSRKQTRFRSRLYLCRVQSALSASLHRCIGGSFRSWVNLLFSLFFQYRRGRAVRPGDSIRSGVASRGRGSAAARACRQRRAGADGFLRGGGEVAEIVGETGGENASGLFEGVRGGEGVVNKLCARNHERWSDYFRSVPNCSNSLLFRSDATQYVIPARTQ
jgi:hypothetical protein